jgi:hypothetical protein
MDGLFLGGLDGTAIRFNVVGYRHRRYMLVVPSILIITSP